MLPPPQHNYKSERKERQQRNQRERRKRHQNRAVALLHSGALLHEISKKGKKVLVDRYVLEATPIKEGRTDAE